MVKLTAAPGKQIVLKPKDSKPVVVTSKISLTPRNVSPVKRTILKPIINTPQRKLDPGLAIVRPVKGFRVRVSNIAYDVKEEDIRASFAVIGKILACTLKDGTAIVTFDRKDDATAAIEKYHQGDIQGRKIFLDFD